MSTDQKTQLQLIDISKTYPEDLVILEEVNFSLDKGEFAFLVGESGAGKSTIIKMLIREEEPTTGDILLEGENLLEIPKKNIHEVRRRIGVVFQDFKLLDSRTVYENVAIALEVNNTPEEEMREIIPNVLSMVDLSSKKDYLPHQLSGGEKQRVSIARALAQEPDILVADEPTGMIDPDSGNKVMEILNQINQRGTTILMATHDRDIVDKWKKRVIRLTEGKISSDKREGKYNE